MKQLKARAEIVIGFGAVVGGGLSLALAVAFGLGGREVVHSYLSSRILIQDLKPGMNVTMVNLYNNASGQVKKVGVFYTTIQTPEGSLKIPNDLITNTPLRVQSGGRSDDFQWPTPGRGNFHLE